MQRKMPVCPESSEFLAVGVFGNLEVTLLQVQFTEDHGAVKVGGEKGNAEQRLDHWVYQWVDFSPVNEGER